MLMFLVTTVGAILSITVTVAVPVVTLLLASVAVRVTVFGPVLVQLNVFGETLMPKVQLSYVPPSTSPGAIDALPWASRLMLMFLVTTVGAILSITVTVAVPMVTLLLASVAVRVTVFGPVLVDRK